MFKRFCLMVLAVVVCSLLAVPAGATQKTPTLLTYFKTSSIEQYAYVTPTLTALGVDTCVVSIPLARDIPYNLVTGVPTWRILVGGRTTTANVDSLKCEVWLGRTSRQYRNTALTGILNNKQKAFDVTLYPLPTFRMLTLYITNGDSTAAVFDLDVGVIRGY